MGLKNLRKIPGVTLIEVIFAIIIFGTGILIILSTITNNIRWIYDIKERDTALSIAKEGIDIVYHIRDSNLERGLFRDCAEIDLGAGGCGRYFYDDSGITKHIIDFDIDALYDMQAFTTTGAASLYYHTGTLYTLAGTDVEGFWYNHDSVGGNDTIFTRILEFRPATGYEGFTGFILEVSSRVIYTRGGDEKEVILQSLIGDIR